MVSVCVIWIELNSEFVLLFGFFPIPITELVNKLETPALRI